jgi:hypothetical protein
VNSSIENIELNLNGKSVKGKKLTVSSELNIDINNAWNEVQKSSLLEFVAKGKIKFIPSVGKFPEKWEEDLTVTTKMIAYGFIPFGGVHTLHFAKINKEDKILETKEKDSFAKVWNHKISMKSIGENSIYYEDEIVI